MSLPGDFTFVDLQAPLGHVPHPLLALLAAVLGQEVDVRSFIRHLKVTDTAVPLRRRRRRNEIQQPYVRQKTEQHGVLSASESDLATEVDDSSVWVEKWQKDATAGVQFLQGQWLSEVLLLKKKRCRNIHSYIFDHIQVCLSLMWDSAEQQRVLKFKSPQFKV